MLRWAFWFLIVALIAAGFGFSGLATATFSIAKILVVLFVVTLVMGLIATRRNCFTADFTDSARICSGLTARDGAGSADPVVVVEQRKAYCLRT